MIAGQTFSLYVGLRFAKAVGLVFGVCVALLFLLDFVELSRRASEKTGIEAGTLALVALYRLPALSEQLLPFAVLFGAMGSMLLLSRRLEFVVARAAGISAWQFLFPALVLALLIGVFSTAVYNPLAAHFKEKSNALEVQLFSNGGIGFRFGGSNSWLRQDSADGPSILHARQSSDQGLTLADVTVFSFDSSGEFRERIDAKTARLRRGRWDLSDVTVTTPDAVRRRFEHYALATYLTPEQIRESFASPDSVSFWQLPAYIALAEGAGLPAHNYRLQFQSLLARPVLLFAMVLIAATVSLRVFRFGNIGRMILGGVIAGFLLYVLSELAGDFGTAGIVDAAVAAWSPAVIAVLLGVTVLLYQEDG